jgi:hypothetical protein
MTALADIDEFLPELHTYAPAVPDPVAHRHIRNAARDFCKLTRIWRERDTITMSTADQDAVITIQDAEVYEIEAADWGAERRVLTIETVRGLDAIRPTWRTETIAGDDVGEPLYITQLFPSTLTVVPRAAGTVQADLILVPSRDALALPAVLLNHHAETIGYGAAARALRIPNTEYYSPDIARSLNADFNRMTENARRAVSKTQLRVPQRTKASWF